jgi:hypothetical protein
VRTNKIKYIHEVIKGMLTKRGRDLKSEFFIITDEAPAMIGRGRGLVARLKEDHPDLTNHCIIHLSVLCASLGNEYSEVMTTMMKLINGICYEAF